jgi:hypothetical protein
MGKLIKLIFLIIAVLVLIFIVVGVFRGVSIIGNEAKKPNQSTSVMPGKSEYDKVRVGDVKTGKGGMTLKEVESILGKSTSQTEGTSGNLKMEIYTFASTGGPNSILVTFISGHASGKSQTGLK